MKLSFLFGLTCGLLTTYLLMVIFHQKYFETETVSVTATEPHVARVLKESEQRPNGISLASTSKRKLITYNIIIPSPGGLLKPLRETWANMAKHVHYYMSLEAGLTHAPNPFITTLDDRDGYPLLSTLKLMCQREGAEFYWYALLSGSTYLKVVEFESLLRKISTSRPFALGSMEISKRGDRPLEIYCSEMGVVMNHHLIEKICPKLLHCRKSVKLSNEASELSQCVSNITGRPLCTHSSKLQDLFYHAHGHFSTEDLQSGVHEANPRLVQSLGFYPLTEPDHFHHFHHHMQRLKFSQLTKLHHSIIHHHAVQLFNAFKPHRVPLRRLPLLAEGRGILNLSLVQPGCINSLNKVFPKLLLNTKALHPLHHIVNDVEKGIFKFKAVSSSNGKSLISYTQKSFLPWSIKRLQQSTYKTEKINFVVGVPPVSQSFQRFMITFEMSFLSHRSTSKVGLLVVLFSSSQVRVTKKSIFAVATLVEMYQHKYPYADIRIASTEEEPTWENLLLKSVEEYLPYELVFIATTNLDFSAQVSDNCLSNTVEGQQLYFPMVFSPFDPVEYQKNRLLYPYATKLRIKDGGWLPPLPNIACLYTSDLMSLLEARKSSFKHQADISLLELVNVVDDLRVFSSPDPSLVHLWREGCNVEMTEASSAYCDVFSSSQMCQCSV